VSIIKRSATIQPISIKATHNTLLDQCVLPTTIDLQLLKCSVLTQYTHLEMHFLPVLAIVSVFTLQHLHYIHQLLFFLLCYIVRPNGVGQLILRVIHLHFFLLQLILNLFLLPEKLTLFSRQLHVHHIKLLDVFIVLQMLSH
jgi:hypothetical protein